jgi:hypothetical protein
MSWTGNGGNRAQARRYLSSSALFCGATGEVGVDDDERADEIERLLNELSEARTRRAALHVEAENFLTMLPDIRAAFGNPFFYSHPEDAYESAANYTGFSSHDVFTPTVLALRRVDRELSKIKERLRALGVNAEWPPVSRTPTLESAR